MKSCSKCKTEKPLEDFGMRKRGKDGRNPVCRVCEKARILAWRKANPEKVKTQAAAWKSANPEWFKTHHYKRKSQGRKRVYVPQQTKERSAAWRAKNPDRVRSYNAAYSAAHKEQAKAWRRANRSADRIHKQNRRHKERNGKLSSGLIEKLFTLQRGRCACCGLPLGNKYHLDHIMPIALGGAHTDNNMQLLRQECNLQKHAKHPVAFMQERGLLL